MLNFNFCYYSLNAKIDKPTSCHIATDADVSLIVPMVSLL